MVELLRIPGIGKTSLELLEAAGFHDAASLAKADLIELTSQIERANAILKISKRTPGQAAIGKWILAARQSLGLPDASTAPAAMPVNYELSPEVVSMLAAAPFAIPLPASILVENKLGVADIPAAIMLNRYSGDLDVKVAQRVPDTKPTGVPVSLPPKPVATGSSFVRMAEPASQRLEVDTSRMRTTGDQVGGMVKVPSSGDAPLDDRLTLLRTPRVSTNKGRNPESRWYIRGVLHTHPISIYLGAISTVLLMFMTPLAVFAAAMLLLSREMPKYFSWVPAWWLVFPVILPLFGVLYFIWGVNGNCRICGQKLFLHRQHLKNSRAHHVTGLGYIFPLCVQMILFRWFRCTHCGTPVRLKK